MAELKTQPTGASVDAFLASVPDEQRRNDCHTVLRLMREATGAEPQMWGDSIVGFGEKHYKYASGRELDWFVVGFSPRKQALTLYLAMGFAADEALVSRLGKVKTSEVCLYINRLAQINLDALRQLIEVSVARVRAS